MGDCMKKYLVIFALFLLGCSSIPTGDVIEAGDSVAVRYTGTTDGKVFDTNIVEIAEANNLPAHGELLTFVAGSGQLIAGFDEGVLGMAEGEKKTITIQPEDGYGPYDESNVQTIPRYDVFNITSAVPRALELTPMQYSAVFTAPPEVGQIASTELSPFDYEITSVTETTVSLFALAEVGQKISSPNVGWDSEVIAVTDDQLTLFADVSSGQEVMTSLGPAIVNVHGNELQVTLQPDIGEKIQTPTGVVTIKDVTDEEVILDLNHELAGKVLEFEIEVVELTKSG